MTDKEEIVYLSLLDFRPKSIALRQELESFPIQSIQDIYLSDEWFGDMFEWALPVKESVYYHMSKLSRLESLKDRTEYIKNIKGQKLLIPDQFKIREAL